MHFRCRIRPPNCGAIPKRDRFKVCPSSERNGDGTDHALGGGR
jgi:hypothetical protein